MSTRYSTPTAAVHVWYDMAAASDRGIDEYYSISEVDDDGDEIICVGGSRNRLTAWELGCEHADDLNVECVEMADESGRVTDRYTPAERAE